MIRAFRTILALCLLLSIKSMQAQTTDPIEAAQQTIAHINSLLESEQIPDYRDVSVDMEKTKVEDAGIDEWSKAMQKSHSSKSGLELRAGYDLKFGEGSDEFYDDLYSYRNRLNVMLSWDMLGSGLFGKKDIEQQATLEAEQLKIKARSLHYAELEFAQSEELAQMFDGYLNRVYVTQIELYESLLVLLNKLQEQGSSTKIESAEVELQITMLKGLVRETPFHTEQLFDFEDYAAMQKRLDDQAIETLVEQSSALESRVIDEKLLSNEIEQKKYWKSIKVSPYAKAQQYSDAYFESSRTTANIGVTATLPIFSGNKSRKAELLSESKLASNATLREGKTLRMKIGEVALLLNRNLEELNASILLEQLYRQQIELAEEAYSYKQLTMQELAKEYIKLLSLHAQIIGQVESRESLKMKLMLTAI